MKRFQFQVVQEFNCTYEVVAETAEEAWDLLMDNDSSVTSVDQSPGDITGTLADASVEEVQH